MSDMINELQKAMGRLWTDNRLGVERIVIGRDGMLAWRETEEEFACYAPHLSAKISAVLNPCDGEFVPVVVNPKMIEAPWVMESRPCV